MLVTFHLKQEPDGSITPKKEMPIIPIGDHVAIRLYDDRLSGNLSVAEIFPSELVMKALEEFFLQRGVTFSPEDTSIPGSEGAKTRGYFLLITRFNKA